VSEQSFFTAMKNKFIEEGGADEAGRYLAICLAEALRENSKLRAALFPGASSAGRLQVEKEVRYLRHEKGWKQADLALVGAEGHPAAIVEVKMEDSWVDGQPEAYRDYCTRWEIPLLVISRYPLTAEEKSRVDGCEWRALTVNGLYQQVLALSADRYPVTRLLGKFLEENEMIYQRYIDDGICLLLSRVFLGSDKAHKLKMDDLYTNIPSALTAIFGTLRTVGQAVRERVELPKRTQATKKWMNVTVDVTFSPYVRLKELQASVAHAVKSKDDEVWLGRYGAHRSGSALFLASLQIGTSAKQTYLCFGLNVTVEKGSHEMRLQTWISPETTEEVSLEVVRPKVKFKDGRWDLGAEEELVEDIVRGLKRSLKAYLKEYGAAAKKGAEGIKGQVSRLPQLREVKIA